MYLCHNVLVDSLFGRSLHYWQWGVKILHYKCVTIYIFFEVLQDFPYIFGCSYVGYIYVYNVYVFLINSSLQYYDVSFFVSFYSLVLKSILSDISIATLPLFSYPLGWNIFFQPFACSMCRPFVHWWVSHRVVCIQIMFSYLFSYLLSFDGRV